MLLLLFLAGGGTASSEPTVPVAIYLSRTDGGIQISGESGADLRTDSGIAITATDTTNRLSS